jgi:hypothetical protein
VRFAVVCVLVLTGVASAAPATPAITAQDLIDVANGARQPDDLTASMPLQDRVAAIHQLVRAGGSCKLAPDGCEVTGDYEAPDSKATAKSPCFRRWELYTLLYDLPLDEMLHLNAGELRAVTKLDDNLVDFIGRDLDSHQQVELAHLLQEKKREIPFPMTLDNADAMRAVKRYQLDEAVASIDPGESDAARDMLIRVVLDPRYRGATRSDALDRLADSTSDATDPLYSIIGPLIADPSIELAANVAYRTGAEMRRPATTNPAIFMRALAILNQANMGQPDYAMTYAPRGLDIVSPSGELLGHYDGGESVTVELTGRLKTEPPIFGRDAHGNIILVGFIEAPEQAELVDSCQGRALPDY